MLQQLLQLHVYVRAVKSNAFNHTYRKLASSKVNDARNSHVEDAPHTYEMSSGDNIRPTQMGDHSEASASAMSSQASAPPPRSSLNDITLIDNDLYQ